MLKSRRGAEPSVALAVLGLIVTALVTIFQTDGTPVLSDALLGVLLLLVAGAYADMMPEGFRARAAFAMVRGAAVWLVVSGLVYGLLGDPRLAPMITPLMDQTAAVMPQMYWFPLGWLILSLLCLPFGPKGQARVAH